MTTVNYSPTFDAETFNGISEENNILMDHLTLGTAGLIGLLQMRLGIHHAVQSPSERTVLYYRALKQYMAQHPENILSNSFDVAGLDTAKQCLMWRDALRFDGWTAQTPVVSQRTEVLNGVEKLFSSPSTGDFLAEVKEALAKSTKQCCADLTVVLPVERAYLHPQINRLLVLMEARGAKVSTEKRKTFAQDNPTSDKTTRSNLERVQNAVATFSEEKIAMATNDPSLQIYSFETQRDMMEYWAVRGEQEAADLWICPNRKTLDNWIRLAGCATVGSSVGKAVPQMEQLFMLGIGLFASPLNLNTLIDWLSAPVHPLPAKLRYELADATASKGGFFNSECQQIIDAYLAGDDEQQPSKQERENISLFLPIRSDDGLVEVGRLRAWAGTLGSWADKRGAMMLQEAGSEQWAHQLFKLSQMTQTLLLLLEDETESRIEYSTIESWLRTLYKADSYAQYAPQCGCQMTISGPEQMAAQSKTTAWIEMHALEQTDLDAAFLLPSEREALSQLESIHFYEEDVESAFHQQMTLRALLQTTQRLTLSVCERLNSGEPQKHPLMVLIENMMESEEELQKITVCPTLTPDDYAQEKRIAHFSLRGHIPFTNADKLQWPKTMSYSSLDTLLQHPFDFLMENMLRISPAPQNGTPMLKTVKGSVAHMMIEHLFGPRGEEGRQHPTTAQEAEQRVNEEYDKAFETITNAYGAQLLLPENKMEAALFKEQLRMCLYRLAGIVKENNLRIVQCEQHLEQSMGFLSSAEPDTNGYVDMTLEDADGSPIIFDFKWSGYKNKYKNLLKEDASIQLELYRAMLAKETGREVKRTAYFLMPEGMLYSKEAFKGTYVKQVDTDGSNDLLERMHNSFAYRREQLSNGIMEIADGFPASESLYGADTDEKKLVPLKTDKGGKVEPNKFSNLSVFM